MKVILKFKLLAALAVCLPLCSWVSEGQEEDLLKSVLNKIKPQGQPAGWEGAAQVAMKWGQFFVKGDIKSCLSLCDQFSGSELQFVTQRIKRHHVLIRNWGYGVPVGVSGVEFFLALLLFCCIAEDAGGSPIAVPFHVYVVPEGGRWYVEGHDPLRLARKFPISGFRGRAREYVDEISTQGVFKGRWEMTVWGEERFIPELSEFSEGSPEQVGAMFIREWIRGDADTLFNSLGGVIRSHLKSPKALKKRIEQDEREAGLKVLALYKGPIPIYVAYLWLKTSQQGVERLKVPGEDKYVRLHERYIPYRFPLRVMLTREDGQWRMVEFIGGAKMFGTIVPKGARLDLGSPHAHPQGARSKGKR